MAEKFGNLRHGNAATDRDHGALVRVIAGFCTAVMLLALVARLLMRWPWKSLYGKDDAAAMVGSAFAVAQILAVTSAVSKGFGKTHADLSPGALDTIEKLVYTSDILFVAALFLAKSAVGLLYGRLSNDKKLARYVAILTVAPGACGLLCMILIAVPKSSATPWTFGPATADGMVGCWIAVTIMSILIEIGLSAFPVWLVKDLQMARSPKILVILATWIRLPLIPISILRVLSLSNSVHGHDFSLRYASTEVFTQIEMSYALVNATTLCLHNFLRLANSGLMDMTVGTGGTIDSAPYGKGSGARSRQTSSKPRHMKGFDSVHLTSLSQAQHTANAAPADGMSIASDSSQRHIMVRQTVDLHYGPSDQAGQRAVMP